MIILGRVRFGEESGKDESKRREKGKRGPGCRGEASFEGWPLASER